jgi:hypothetical protein
MLSVSHVITFKAVSIYYEIQQNDHATGGDLVIYIFFLISSFNQSKMADVQTSEMGAKLVPVNVGPLNFVCRCLQMMNTRCSANSGVHTAAILIFIEIKMYTDWVPTVASPSCHISYKSVY